LSTAGIQAFLNFKVNRDGFYPYKMFGDESWSSYDSGCEPSSMRWLFAVRPTGTAGVEDLVTITVHAAKLRHAPHHLQCGLAAGLLVAYSERVWGVIALSLKHDVACYAIGANAQAAAVTKPIAGSAAAVEDAVRSCALTVSAF
jgi:hypothetical protein